ncbi:MAG: hypothetical protein AVDCRST_MAG11-896, partial [uncultured Gemmatimonadaceae bacterium]
EDGAAARPRARGRRGARRLLGRPRGRQPGSHPGRPAPDPRRGEQLRDRDVRRPLQRARRDHPHHGDRVRRAGARRQLRRRGALVSRDHQPRRHQRAVGADAARALGLRVGDRAHEDPAGLRVRGRRLGGARQPAGGLRQPPARRERVQGRVRRRPGGVRLRPLHARPGAVHRGDPPRAAQEHRRRDPRRVRRAGLGARRARRLGGRGGRRAAGAGGVLLPRPLLHQHHAREQLARAGDVRAARVHRVRHAVGAGVQRPARAVGHDLHQLGAHDGPDRAGRQDAVLPPAEVPRPGRRRPAHQGRGDADAARRGGAAPRRHPGRVHAHQPAARDLRRARCARHAHRHHRGVAHAAARVRRGGVARGAAPLAAPALAGGHRPREDHLPRRPRHLHPDQPRGAAVQPERGGGL